MKIPNYFNKTGISNELNSSNIPLTFTAASDAAIISLNSTGSPVVDGLQYRLNSADSWQTYTIGETFTLNTSEYIQFQNTNEQLSVAERSYVTFVLVGSFNASGNIQSLLNYSDICPDYGFFKLFNSCSNLLSAPLMPAKQVGLRSYGNTFQECLNLTTAPLLPATTIGEQCYWGMFYNCTSLTTVPTILPATTLADSCYDSMFNKCVNLTSAPELPATLLKKRCYIAMFLNCSSLTTAPTILPATTLADNCYYNLFYGCSNLNYIKVAFTEWHSSATKYWVYGVSSTGTFDAPRELSIEYGDSRIPTNWSLPNHQYIILVEDQKIFSKYNNEINYNIDYWLLPETLQPTFTIIEGSLPNGLTLSSDGKITGTSTEEFEGNVVIQISCEGCESVTMTLTLTLFDAIETENNLTSNTSNEKYEVSQSADYISYYAWKAMDGNNSTYSETNFDHNKDGWWQIKFNEGPVFLKYITGKFQAYYTSSTLYLDVSNDGETFENVTSFTGGSDLIIKLDLTAPYQYYRIRNSKNNYYIQITEIKFLYNYALNFLAASDQKFTFTMNEESEYQIKYVNTSETAATFAIIDGTLPEGISFDAATGKFSGTATEEFEGALTIQISNTYNTVLIQIDVVILSDKLLFTPHNLTSNTSNPSFVVSQSSDQDSTRLAWRAMDGSNDDPEVDCSHTSRSNNNWWQIQFVDGPVNVQQIYFTWRVGTGGNDNVSEYMLQGSNDGSTFEDIIAFSVDKTTLTTTEITTNNENYYSFYRLKNNSGTSQYLIIGLIEFAYVK